MLKQYTVYFFLLVIFFFQNKAFSQLSLTGKIITNSNKPVEIALITLNNDSSFNQSLSPNKGGVFNITNLKKGKYNLTISSIGFNKKDTSFVLSSNLSIEILLTPKIIQLDSVTIRSRKNFIKNKADRFVFNIEGNSLYENKSITEILRTIPLLSVSRNGIELKGSGPVAVMIDERLIYLSNKDLLDYLNVFKNDIASIEIIPNPSARYEANGSALLNIVTKNKKPYGFFGTIETGYTKTTYSGYDETINLSFRDKNFSLIATGGKSIGSYQEEVNTSNTFYLPINTSYYEKAINKNNYNDNSFNLVGELLLNKNTKLYSSYSYRDNFGNTTLGQALNYFNNYQLDSVGKVSGINKSNGNINILTFGLNSIYGKNKNNMDLVFDYVNKSSISENNSETINYFNNNKPTNSIYNLYSYGNIPKNVLSTKADFKLPNFYNKVNVEFGLKYIVFNNNSKTDYNEYLNNLTIFKGINTADTFNYKEQNIAAYLMVKKDYKKWSTNFGLRYEQTITEGNSRELRSNNNFKNFFPSAFILYNITDETNLNISYTKRILRPTIYDVNPFKLFNNLYSYYEGNPALIPSLQDSYNFNFTLKGNYLFRAFYNVTYNPIVSFPYNEGKLIKIIKQNNGTIKKYGFFANASLNLKTWLQSNFSINVNSYKYNTNYVYTTNGTPINIDLSSSQSVQFSDTFSMDLDYSITFPGGGDNIIAFKSYSGLDCGFTRLLFKKKITLSISVSDIFRTEVQGSTTQTNQFKTSLDNYYDFRQLTASLKYKFGKEVKVVRKKANLSDINRIN